jgi:hypothetical protein
MKDRSWIPGDVDPERPSIARIYDFYLGGHHHLPADREAAREVVEMMPELPAMLRVNRAFLRRGVRHLADSGVRNFLDLGSGIPTVDNVHDIAQAVDGSARIVYVDNDPVAVKHSRLMLSGNPHAAIVDHDLRDAVSVLGDPEVQQLLQPGRGEPMAVLMSAVLHFVPDDDEAAALIAAYRLAMPPGSYLLVSHGSHKRDSAERAELAAERYSRTVAPMKLRSMDELSRLLKGFELVDPGVVYCSEWRPEPYYTSVQTDPLPQICAIARKA